VVLQAAHLRTGRHGAMPGFPWRGHGAQSPRTWSRSCPDAAVAGKGRMCTMPTAPATAFTDAADTWNRRFEAGGYLFGTEPNAWLHERRGLLQPGQRVLSVADGEGRNSVWLAQQGLSVDAFDISPVGVAKARALAAERGVTVRFAVSDVDGFAWPAAAYDAVAAIFVQFADPALRERLFAHIRASLKPGGLLLLQGYTPKQLEYKTGGPPFLAHLYTVPMLREVFADWDVLELHDYEAVIDEGAGHKGMSALVGMVARRR